MADICSVCGPHRPLEYFSHPVPQHQLPILYLHMFRFPRLWGGYSLQLPPTQISSSEGRASLGKCQGNRKGLFPYSGARFQRSAREGSKTETPPPDISLLTPPICRAMVSSGEEQPSFLARGAEYTRLLEE